MATKVPLLSPQNDQTLLTVHSDIRTQSNDGKRVFCWKRGRSCTPCHRVASSGTLLVSSIFLIGQIGSTAVRAFLMLHQPLYHALVMEVLIVRK